MAPRQVLSVTPFVWDTLCLVASRSGLQAGELLASRNRIRSANVARTRAFVLLFEHRESIAAIAQYFGGIESTTVKSAIENHRSEEDRSPEERDAMEQLRISITSVAEKNRYRHFPDGEPVDPSIACNLAEHICTTPTDQIALTGNQIRALARGYLDEFLKEQKQ